MSCVAGRFHRPAIMLLELVVGKFVTMKSCCKRHDFLPKYHMISLTCTFCLILSLPLYQLFMPQIMWRYDRRFCITISAREAFPIFARTILYILLFSTLGIISRIEVLCLTLPIFFPISNLFDKKREQLSLKSCFFKLLIEFFTKDFLTNVCMFKWNYKHRQVTIATIEKQTNIL